MTAKWLGVAPWELLAQPSFWLEWGQTAMSAEGGAQAEIQKRHDRQSRVKGGR